MQALGFKVVLGHNAWSFFSSGEAAAFEGETSELRFDSVYISGKLRKWQASYTFCGVSIKALRMILLLQRKDVDEQLNVSGLL